MYEAKKKRKKFSLFVTLTFCAQFPPHFTVLNKDLEKCLSYGWHTNGNIFTAYISHWNKGQLCHFNSAIIPWWPFIHAVGALWLKPMWWKSPRLFFFFLSEKGISFCFDLSEECFVCSLIFFSFPFSAVSGCLTVQEQSPNLQRRGLLQTFVI